ncbi:MAG: hypothetical protein CML68_01655 [Rhodobacteraceae bacterium]|nr:hypothetical protein [Paracoccaceae bacterium]
MFMELIATFCAGIGAAGLMMAIGLAWKAMPRWLIPAMGGLAMICFTVWSEYSWGDRTIEGLPEGVQTVETRSDTYPWKPWTYAFPQVTRVLAVDTSNVQTKDEAPGVKLVDLYLFARWRATATIAQLIDCGTAARADVTEDTLADPAAATWQELGEADPLITAVCT